MGSGFSFAVLGPVRAWHDGSEVDLGSPQQRAVLAVLLLRAEAHVPAEAIVDALWPEDPPRSAVGTVRTYVYRLRRLLGGEELIRSAGNAYVLALPRDALDVARFRRAVERAQRARADGDVALAAEHLHEGLDLWHGPPLAGIQGRFAETQRALLEEQWLTATEDSLDSDLELGKHAEVIPALTTLADENPYRERLRALLMLALYRAGRQAEALAAFDRARRLLREELGIEPGPRMRDLQLRILNADPDLMDLPAAEQPPAAQQPPAAGEPALTAPAGQTQGHDTRAFHVPPAQLPRDLATFAGRRADLDYVLAGFPGERERDHADGRDPGAASVTVIAGMPGVGKTTLAVHAAHLLAERFPDGQLYVDLRGFDRSGMVLSPRDAIRQLLAGLGVPAERVPVEADAQVGLYRSVLAGRRVLIVLDNARNADQVRALLPGARDCQVLVTSRDQMRSLIAMEGARLVGLSPLSPDDAREALVRRLGADRVAAEPAAVDRIAALCAGLPLTLSIVAARAATRPAHSLASIAADLTWTGSGTSLHALSDSDSALDARASLSLSYRELSPGAARLLRLSSLHPGAEVSRDAMASLAGVGAAQAAAGLDELERTHLMTQPEPWRYASHDLVRAYAAELAAAAEDEDEDEDAATTRMFDHYRQSAYRAMLLIRPYQGPFTVPAPLDGVTVTEFAGPGDAADWFARNYPVLRVVLDQTVTRGLPEYTWQLAWGLDPFLDRQARWQDEVLVHRAALAAAEKLGDPALQAQSQVNLGMALRMLGDPRRATEHFEAAQRFYTEAGDLGGQARVLHFFAMNFDATDSPEQAFACTVRALKLSRQAHDRELEAISLNNLGCRYSNAGDQAAAIPCVEQSLALFEEIGKVSYRPEVLLTLGQCRCRAGDSELAVAHLAEAISVFRAERNPYQEAYALRWLAITQRQAGNMASARRAWQRALPLLSELGDDLPAFESFAAEDASTRR
jgi:DNA-binding SARP family transcriptional activator